MPCDSITTQFLSEKLKNAHQDVVVDMLIAIRQKLGPREDITWTAGKGLNVRASTQARADEIMAQATRMYSEAAVSWAAKRSGWAAQKTGKNTMVLSKR